jgi:thiol:disulfide interchange protein
VCAVYSIIGFGLALPYLVFLLAPGTRLPEPGAWLPRLREGLGFLAAAGTFWLLYSMARQVRPEGLAWIELSLLGLALVAWLRSREGVGRTLRFALVLGLAACAAAALWMADLNRFEPKPGLPTTTPETSEPLSNPTSASGG